MAGRTAVRDSIVPFRHENDQVGPFAASPFRAMLPPVSLPDAQAERGLPASTPRAESTTATEDAQTGLVGGLISRPQRPVRILVVDDHEGFRSSMVQALDLIPDVEVAGEAR